MPFCTEAIVLGCDALDIPTHRENDLFSLRLGLPARWNEGSLSPGQFVMLRLKDMGQDMIWGRPFSICSASKTELLLFIQASGRATRRIKSLRPGDTVDVWGPLGNAFAVEPASPTLLLAGGIGIAPFIGYIARHPAPENLILEFGHRRPVDAYPFAACRRIAARSHLERNHDDLNKFIALLDQSIRQTAERKGLALACGPHPFLRTAQTFALRHGARMQLSLETRMACGVGACQGCVVQASPSCLETQDASGSRQTTSWVQTCTCGPVFWADQVVLA